MAKNIIDKYSNYNYYIIGASGTSIPAYKVEEVRLLKVVKACMDMLKKPYIRFMYTDRQEPVCTVYDGDNRVTKLIPLTEVEQMIKEGAFHK